MRYVMCYRASSLQATSNPSTNTTNSIDTYMGEMSVSMANPAYYLNSTSNDGVNKVGKPFTITAFSLCTPTSDTSNNGKSSSGGVADDLNSACSPLTVNDELILIDSKTINKKCGEIVDPTSVSSVEKIGLPKVSTGGGSYVQSFVARTASTFTVCYRPYTASTNTTANTEPFQELVYSVSFVKQDVTVETADPSAATFIPMSPSASQFLTINLICATNSTACASCTTLRLVPGELVSCWSTIPNTVSSDNCITNTQIQFPNVFLS
uniref:Uncharacterized protein n=1 Tax=Lygus hesperus TaxID=30085 RepID=A0A0A9WJ12_LYGHE